MASSIPIARRARGGRSAPHVRLRHERGRRRRGDRLPRLDRGAVRARPTAIPAPGYEMRIVDPETGRDQPASVAGRDPRARLHRHAAATTSKPEETARGHRRRGLVAHRRHGPDAADGHLRFLGRYKDMLKIGGENVDPMEVEAFLMAHPAVNLAAVVGLPDARLSEVGGGVRAAASPASTLTERRGHRALPGPHRELQDSPPRRLRRRVPDDELGQDPEGEAPRAGAAGLGLGLTSHRPRARV